MLIIIIIWIICGFVCEYLGKQKGQTGCFLYGFLLGILGIIIVACLKDKSGKIIENEQFNKYDELQKLQELKNTGTITDAEFETEKQKLLR